MKVIFEWDVNPKFESTIKAFKESKNSKKYTEADMQKCFMAAKTTYLSGSEDGSMYYKYKTFEEYFKQL